MSWIDTNIRDQDPLAKRVIGLAMDVHNTLGTGFLESVYCNALSIEFKKHGIIYVREKRFPVFYDGVEIGYFDSDFLVEGRMVVEVKAVDILGIAHSVQLVNYLAAGKLDLGLLLNFGNRKLEFRTKSRVYHSEEPINLRA